MTLRLTIDEQAWRAHVDAIRSAVPDLVPVVKGNGYGFGRSVLAQAALSWTDQIAVGTVHELADAADAVAQHSAATVVSLTPAMHLPATLPDWAVPTVGSTEHVEVLRQHGWHGRVAVKLQSSMHRHGASPDDLEPLLATVRHAGFDVHEVMLHLPLTSPSYPPATTVDEVEAWLDRVDAHIPLSLSHMAAGDYERVRARHRDRAFRMRSGTSLWHGDKSFLHLSADVLQVRPVTVGQVVGYHRAPIDLSGHLVMIGAGTAHGIAPLDGGLSPFHHARRRMALAEAPHMHTSMVLVAEGDPVPAVGTWVDVQRPLIMVQPDVTEWR